MFCEAAVAACTALRVGFTTPLGFKSEPIAATVSTALIIPSEMVAASRSTFGSTFDCFSSSGDAAMSQAARWDAAPAHWQRGCGTKAEAARHASMCERAGRGVAVEAAEDLRRFCPFGWWEAIQRTVRFALNLPAISTSEPVICVRGKSHPFVRVFYPFARHSAAACQHDASACGRTASSWLTSRPLSHKPAVPHRPTTPAPHQLRCAPRLSTGTSGALLSRVLRCSRGPSSTLGSLAGRRPRPTGWSACR